MTPNIHLMPQRISMHYGPVKVQTKVQLRISLGFLTSSNLTKLELFSNKDSPKRIGYLNLHHTFQIHSCWSSWKAFSLLPQNCALQWWKRGQVYKHWRDVTTFARHCELQLLCFSLFSALSLKLVHSSFKRCSVKTCLVEKSSPTAARPHWRGAMGHWGGGATGVWREGQTGGRGRGQSVTAIQWTWGPVTCSWPSRSL